LFLDQLTDVNGGHATKLTLKELKR
jgi:hypothetical protein